VHAATQVVSAFLTIPGYDEPDNENASAVCGNPLLSLNPLLGFNDCLKQESVTSFKAKDTVLLEFIDSLNKALPDDIRTFHVTRVTKTFDARVMCSKRQYEYVLPVGVLSMIRVSSNGMLSREYLKMLQRNGETVLKSDIKSDIKSDMIEGVTSEEVAVEPDAPNVGATPILDSFAWTNSEPLDPTQMSGFINIMRQYEGTHNFHNFTSSVAANDPSAKRYMEKIEVDYDKIGNECVALIRIKGESFMLNQIRKMIALAVEVHRGSAPVDAISEALTSSERRLIHMAPAEGLFLVKPLYDGYNKSKANPPQKPHVDTTSFEDEILKFKSDRIFKRILASVEEGVWQRWVSDINKRPYFIENYVI